MGSMNISPAGSTPPVAGAPRPAAPPQLDAIPPLSADVVVLTPGSLDPGAVRGASSETAPVSTPTVVPACPTVVASSAPGGPAATGSGVPVCLSSVESPDLTVEARPLVLGDAAVWSSLEAAGWLRDKLSDPPPDRPLTPPEKAGLLAVVDRLRDQGFVIYREQGGDAGVDLRPVEDAELGALLDGKAHPGRLRLSYASETAPDRFGFIHSLRRIPELAFFSGVSEQPHGLAEPEAGAALRQLTGDGWKVRQCQDSTFTSEPLHPEKAYMLLAGGRREENYRSWYSLQLESPAGAKLRVHTAAQMALLGTTPPSSPAVRFLEESRDTPFQQAALDIASMLDSSSSVQDAHERLAAATTHLLPLVSSGRLPEVAVHHILDALAPPLGETTSASRIALFTRLLDAITSPAGASGGETWDALDCWTAMAANARADGPGEASPGTSKSLGEAAQAQPAGTSLDRQVDVATRILPFVDRQERDAALVLVLVDLPREQPGAVEAATRLIRAGVPVDQVREGLADLAPLDASASERLERMEALATAFGPHAPRADVLPDYRAARDLPLGSLSAGERNDVLCHLVQGLAQRDEASQARRVYGQFCASAREGHLADEEVGPAVTRFLSSLASGASIPRALGQSRPPRSADQAAVIEKRIAQTRLEAERRLAAASPQADLSADVRALAHDCPDVPELAVAAALLDGASPETGARIARLALEAQATAAAPGGQPESVPSQVARFVAQGATAEEQLALGATALDILSRVPGCEEGGRLVLDTLDQMTKETVEVRAAALADALPQVAASSGEELATLGSSLVKHVGFFGAPVRHVVLEALKHDAEMGPSIRVGLEALAACPKNLMSYDRACAEILDGRAIRGGAALAGLGKSVYHTIDRGYRGSEGLVAARAYMKALQGDPEVGTAMGLANEICGSEALRGSEYLQIYVAEAALEHPTASTGQELAQMCLTAVDSVPEGSARTAVHLSQPLLEALGRLYSDGPSRTVILEALRASSKALQASMAFGNSAEGDASARKITRDALVQLRETEDATTRLHRRVAEMETAQTIETEGDFVVVGGVRIPRRT